MMMMGVFINTKKESINLIAGSICSNASGSFEAKT